MKLFLQKLKKQSGCRNLQCWSYNQNHCVELNIHFSNIGKNISSTIDPPPTTFNDFINESFQTNNSIIKMQNNI